ncbi:MAG: methyl-accepting chemotaxis protein [Acidothermus cellulolyticus]|nr:methyl-accepting chemotaxis protein [Acidothermus cellulolyticus]MBX5447470.1 methyl-accepting chemotaxis protein [Acidothermus cellulolyticus]MCL6549593.1 methyl-accepting chemotaxis protein [Acidothermus cellulolyticus]
MVQTSRAQLLDWQRRLPLPVKFGLAFAGATLPFLIGLAVIAMWADASPEHVRDTAFVTLGVGAAAAAVASWRLSRAVVVPMRRAIDVLREAAAGNLTRRLPGVRRRDEFGAMARALNTMLDAAADAFFAVTTGIRLLAQTSGRLAQTATKLADSADRASDQSTLVSYAADQVSSNVVGVAGSSEQMAAAIRDIADNASRAAAVAAEAAATAERADSTVAKLGESSAEIGNILKVITSIARQTHLLALNATIEAARAGEAGRGFAVVAAEVKDLADATARATDDIAQMIKTIQDDAAEAVTMIRQISAVVDRINDFQSTIAGAVEEQTASSNEMTRAIAGAAAASEDIAGSIVGVAAAALATASGVGDTRLASADLAHTANQLEGVVRRFRY